MSQKDPDHSAFKRYVLDLMKPVNPVIKSFVKGQTTSKLPLIDKDSSFAPVYQGFEDLLNVIKDQTEQIKRLHDELEFNKLVAEENPNPVLQFSVNGNSLSYLNSAGKSLMNSLKKREKQVIVVDWLDDMIKSIKTNRSFNRELHSSK